MSDTPLPNGTRVRLNAAAHARLGSSRARNPDVISTVEGYVSIPRSGEDETRNNIRWDGSANLEQIQPKYLEVVT